MTMYFSPCDKHRGNNDLLSIIQSSFSKCKILEILDKEYSDFIGIFISPNNEMGKFIKKQLLKKNSKIILFGKIPHNLLDLVEGKEIYNSDYKKDSGIQPAQPNKTSMSKLHIHYNQFKDLDISGIFDRPLKRFDYEDEWNNLGFDFINREEIANYSFNCDNYLSLASLLFDEQKIGDFSGIFDFKESSLLWVGSETSYFRSNEWSIVEKYFSNYKENIYPCHPYISQIPYDYQSMVTMRLDCDESIINSEPLRKLYSSFNIPFSLAITTKLLSQTNESDYLKDVSYQGVDILSHSDSHAEHWGGSLDNACRELSISKLKLEKLLNKTISYAVSPFHHTPDYIFEALSKSGYKGCVGGTVKYYQNNICARGITINPTDVTFHCQQVMLHGDCMLEDDDPLRVYKQSFTKALHSESIFGYLDHPFSSRYQYGWQSEEQRLEKHSEFINYINKKCHKILWSNETNALDYISWLNKIDISEDEYNYIIEPPKLEATKHAAINYKNKKYPLGTKSISIRK